MLATPAFAHVIPNDIIIRAFFKPEGNRLRVLVRVPMNALPEIVFPERDGKYLDLAKLDAVLPGAAQVWISDLLTVYEDGNALPKPVISNVRIALPSDQSFLDYDSAIAHLNGPSLTDKDLVWTQAWFDASFDYQIQNENSSFSLRYGLARLGVRVLTVFHFLPPHRAERAFEFIDDPGVIDLDPSWFQASMMFVKEGFQHILDGIDHLLFLFCLVIPFRRLRGLVPIVTGFTIAHSVTLFASAYGYAPDALWFPPLIEVLIAISIIYMAIENILGAGSIHRRWLVAFGFGLIHGFGFSFALRQTLQFAGSHVAVSLLSFNLGVELGQLLVLVILIPILTLLFRLGVDERKGTIILSAFVTHTAWHWTVERWEQLRQFPFRWPVLDAAWFGAALQVLTALVVLAFIAWVMDLAFTRWFPLDPKQGVHKGPTSSSGTAA